MINRWKNGAPNRRGDGEGFCIKKKLANGLEAATCFLFTCFFSLFFSEYFSFFFLSFLRVNFPFCPCSYRTLSPPSNGLVVYGGRHTAPATSLQCFKTAIRQRATRLGLVMAKINFKIRPAIFCSISFFLFASRCSFYVFSSECARSMPPPLNNWISFDAEGNVPDGRSTGRSVQIHLI